MRKYFKFAVQLIVAACISAAHAGAYEDFFRGVNLNLADTVSQLLRNGFDPNTLSEQAQHPLYLAMREGSDKVADVLIKAPGVKVDAANAAGETPLMMAALKGRTEWCLRLLDAGAQVHRDGWTPLHYAAAGEGDSAAATVAALLGRNARIDARSPNGTTPLMMAARYGTEGSVSALLKAGADGTLRNEQGLSAADFARLAGREKLSASLQALLK